MWSGFLAIIGMEEKKHATDKKCFALNSRALHWNQEAVKAINVISSIYPTSEWPGCNCFFLRLGLKYHQNKTRLSNLYHRHLRLSHELGQLKSVWYNLIYIIEQAGPAVISVLTRTKTSAVWLMRCGLWRIQWQLSVKYIQNWYWNQFLFLNFSLLSTYLCKIKI